MADYNPHVDTVEEMAAEWATEQWSADTMTSNTMRILSQHAFSEGARWAITEMKRQIAEMTP